MLDTDSRSVAIELLRPPIGYRLDFAVILSYTLSLEALLALPLAIFSHLDTDFEDLLKDPLRLLRSLQEARDRVHVFVDERGVQVPRKTHPIMVVLQESVHLVRAPNEGVFHPKLWLARFISDEGELCVRLVILSRNLTFDRSMDLALVSEAIPGDHPVSHSEPLRDLLVELDSMNTSRSIRSQKYRQQIIELSEQVARCTFPAPDEFSQSPINFHASGIRQSVQWKPSVDNGSRLLAVSPFVSQSTLNEVRKIIKNKGKAQLISRREELELIPRKCIEEWDDVDVVTDIPLEDSEEQEESQQLRLHAKFLVVEHGRLATWIVGSANLTHAAREGKNVEVTAQLTGPKHQVGISEFLENFEHLCEKYTPSSGPINGIDLEQKVLDEFIREFLQAQTLAIRCTLSKSKELWDWKLSGDHPTNNEIELLVWPISVDQKQSQSLRGKVTWINMPVERLTAFVAISITVKKNPKIHKLFVLKLPISGVPNQQVEKVLQSLIDSPEKLLQFLRLLLVGFDEIVQPKEAKSLSRSPTIAGMNLDTLLEDLLRTASRKPSQLEPFRSLMKDLQKTEKGRKLVTEKLDLVWKAVETAIH